MTDIDQFMSELKHAAANPEAMTKGQADTMALQFIDLGGPHLMENPLEDEDEVAAALIFLDLVRRGLLKKARRKAGIEYSLTDLGRQHLGRVRNDILAAISTLDLQ